MPTVQTGNDTTHFRISNRAFAHAPAVVCIHGSGGDGIVWSYQLSRLGRHFRVLLPDLPGHGNSGGSPCSDVARYADWLDRFVAALELDDIVLMGHSMGGAVVQAYARMRPLRVRALVLVCTGCRFVLSRRYVDELERTGLSERAELPEQAATLLQDIYGPDYLTLARNGIGALHADILAAGRFDSRDWIAELRQPALVVCGADDRVMPPHRSAELCRGLRNSEQLTIEQAGHGLMIERRDVFTDAVKSFLDRVSGGDHGQ